PPGCAAQRRIPLRAVPAPTAAESRSARNDRAPALPSPGPRTLEERGYRYIARRSRAASRFLRSSPPSASENTCPVESTADPALPRSVAGRVLPRIGRSLPLPALDLPARRTGARATAAAPSS